MSRVKPFSQELLKSIFTALDEYQKITTGPLYAAFDVDGTLWDSDVGENFFQYKIDHAQLPALKPIADPWEHYFALKKKHPPEAYLWLAQICADFPIEQVQEWANEAIKKFPLKVLEPQKKLIADLQSRGIEVFTVSASVKWAVEAANPLVGLARENALGVATQIKNGLVTKEIDGVVTWREGKAQALLQRTKNILPVFCSGNTSGDIHLLELSRTKPLAVQTQIDNSVHANLFDDEQKLLQMARDKQWLTHHFAE